MASSRLRGQQDQQQQAAADAVQDREEQKFHADLELAKRLSLETAREDAVRREQQSPAASYQPQRRHTTDFPRYSPPPPALPPKPAEMPERLGGTDPMYRGSQHAELSRPRPRPEGRASRRSVPERQSFPPPPEPGPKPTNRYSNFDEMSPMEKNEKQASGAASDLIRLDGSTPQMETVKSQVREIYAMLPLQQQQSPTHTSTTIKPPPRTVFPSLNKENELNYNVLKQHPPIPFGAPSLLPAQKTPQLQIQYNPPQQQPMSLQIQPEATSARFGFVPRQSGFNQTVRLPPQSTKFSGPSSLLPIMHQGMTKSQSWTDGGLDRVSSTAATNDPWEKAPSAQEKEKLKTVASSNSIRASLSDYSLSTSTIAKKPSDSLIDFGADTGKFTRVSVLEAFDPLLKDEDEVEEENVSGNDDDGEVHLSTSNLSHNSSFYDPVYDPFEYMQAQASFQPETDISKETDEGKLKPPEGIAYTPNRQNIKKHARQPSISEEVNVETILRRKKQKETYDKCIRKSTLPEAPVSIVSSLKKERDVASDAEIVAFTKMVAEIRSQYRHDDPVTNPGYVISPMIESIYPPNTTVILVIQSPDANKLIKFTCDVTSQIEHIVFKAIYDFESDLSGEPDDYILQVSGTSEYLDKQHKLKDYEYVHQCYKYDRDVRFRLIDGRSLKKPYLRVAEDDQQDTNIRLEDISPKDHVQTLSYDGLHVLLEGLQSEAQRMVGTINQISSSSEKEVMKALRPRQLLQAVKYVSAMLGNIETLEVQEMCDEFVKGCLSLQSSKSSEDATSTESQAKNLKELIGKILDSVHNLLEVYARTFRVNFSFSSSSRPEAVVKESIEVYETLLLRVCALHRLDPAWTFDDYSVTMQIYHGTTPIQVTESKTTEFCGKGESFYEWIKFNTWLETKSVRICSLPRESRLVFTLSGRNIVTSGELTRPEIVELGWASLQLFDFELNLAQGTFLLPLWPPGVEKQVGPAPDSGSHPFADRCQILSVELPELDTKVVFPDKIPIQQPPRREYNFEDLEKLDQEMLLDICDMDVFTFLEDSATKREVLWDKRYYLTKIPGALPKVLLAARSWEYSSLPGLYGLLHSWKRPQSMDILQLFLPCFPDVTVRECAIDWLSQIGSDELVDYLPQLVEALKHETWSNSPLAKLLLVRTLQSPRVAHSLYWLLTQCLPGQTPQNTTFSNEPIALSDKEEVMSAIKLARYRRRLQALMRSLYTVSGSALRLSFCKQQELLKHLYEAGKKVQTVKDSSRNYELYNHMESIHYHLKTNETPLPLSASLIAQGVVVKSSSYFASNTVPLKIVFSTTDQTSTGHKDSMNDTNKPENLLAFPVIYKIGDDLRQDMLTIQMIRVMDKLWLKENLDLKMVTFLCVPTGDRQGMIEMVTEAQTLKEIQVGDKRGVTGTFYDKAVSNWLEKHNPSQLEFAKAVQNFTRSCAGYSIVTYILGICDRHNDNIMVKQTGHLFHIDFGKFLGDAQKFGNFKRDRTPFVLTPDMVYVINGGDKPTQKFHDFIDLCCTGFNIIRKHGNLLLNLFALMASSGIPGVTNDAVRYVQRALLPDLSPSEAAATFSRMIEESLSSWFTQWNFFIHNLAQMKFNGDSADGANGELLSFIPKKYSLQSDGRITAVHVYDIQKRYAPERHYVFILKIEREGMRDPTFLFRTYKEFCELDSKLNLGIGLRKSGGFNLGRQEVREVAERRKHDIKVFLDSLFSCSDDIAHSDLIYTFFHPLLRDQEEANIHLRKLKDQKSRNRDSTSSRRQVKGELKLSLEYRKEALHVMVLHARNLANPDTSRDEPNSYVKIYLHPDPHKVTKRKTKVVRKNCHPSFMEMLEYRLPLESVQGKVLQATVWDCDRFQEKIFLGAVTISLEDINIVGKDTTEWYPLKNLAMRT